MAKQKAKQGNRIGATHARRTWSIRQYEAVRRWIVSIVGIALLIGLIVIDRAGLLLVSDHDDWMTYHGAAARLVRVETGDGLIVDLPDPLNRRSYTRVRLWGVRCEADHAQLAAEARQLTESFLAADAFILVLEKHRTRDTGGRLLAHVDRIDGESLNEALLANGLARVDDTWPHALLLRYDQRQRTARRAKLGMWSERDSSNE